MLVIVTAVAIGAFVITQGLDESRTDVVAAGADVAVGGSTGDDGPSGGAEGEVDSGTIEGATAESPGTTEAGVMADDQIVADDQASTVASDAPDTTTAQATEAAVRAPAEVRVLVLNGAGAKGIAGRGSAVLADAGYDVLAPKNADFLGPSQVLFTDGFEEEAAAIAEVFQVDPVAVVGPLDPADPPIRDTQSASIVVVVGEDGLIDV
ncbi:MAG: LytR C-terminal domain-containing protein [Acidimicrobiia bacterium]|nr:LytR C-terminal domain-containing protein [Acidimicrobiia bacterium]